MPRRRAAKSQKLDLYKQHKAEYIAKKDPQILKVASAQYLTIEGSGAPGPGNQQFQEKISALYGMAFTIKMARKFAGKGDYKVAGLEGLWWTASKKSIWKTPQEKWKWKLMIRVPKFISESDLEAAQQTLIKRGKTASVKEVKLEEISEGWCVQALHVGPYADEPATIARMEGLAEQKEYSFDGRHHELYISDPRRVPPERLKTILRQPIRKR